jgi:ubiquitin-conjugating enzyme E2 variant
MQPSIEPLPEHGEVGPLARVLEVACLAGAAGLLLFHLLRFFTTRWFFSWWMPVVVLAAMFFADFACGVIHWIADTWGSESIPVFGPRFLRPFRLHHINPDDFLRRNFIDTNGDVALIAIVFLLSAFLIPLDNTFGRLVAVFLVASSACALPTNQVHQWAHMSDPSPWVCWLQQRGVLLSQEQHHIHHTAPYATNYCITTGWCNPALTASNFFPAFEWVISRLTGLKPRSEDLEHDARLEACTTGQADVPARKSL